MNGTGRVLEIYPFMPTSCYVEHLHFTAEKENNHHSKPWVKLASIRSLNCNETEGKQNGIFSYLSSPSSDWLFCTLQPWWSTTSLQFAPRYPASAKVVLVPRSVPSFSFTLLRGWGKISAVDSYSCNEPSDNLGQLLYPMYFMGYSNMYFSTSCWPSNLF